MKSNVLTSNAEARRRPVGMVSYIKATDRHPSLRVGFWDTGPYGNDLDMRMCRALDILDAAFPKSEATEIEPDGMWEARFRDGTSCSGHIDLESV